MRLWFQHPDWRLGQLIWNMAGRDPFYIEDYDLIKQGYEKFDKDEITLLDASWPEYWVEPNAFKELIEDINSGKFRVVPKG